MASIPTPLARLPLTRATSPVLYADTPRPIRIRHPGYGDIANNVLLNLPAVDTAGSIEAADMPPALGLHHRTVLTAGAIIADNTFDRAYLTFDQAGTRPVCDVVALDGLLGPGDYWLQLRGAEPPSSAAAQEEDSTRPDETDRTVRHTNTLVSEQEKDKSQGRRDATEAPSIERASMPPPPPRPSHRSPATPATPDYEPYPIVPSFRDWLFPHHNLPQEWISPHVLPATSAPPADPPRPRPLHCYVTGLRMGINKCHLVPSNENDWFSLNGMADYIPGSRGSIDHETNIAILRMCLLSPLVPFCAVVLTLCVGADLHLLFDQRRFVIVPKPSRLSPTTSYALALHVLDTGEGSGELSDLYQNIPLQPEYDKVLSREFVFARFAWALFPFLRNFLEAPVSRRLAVLTRNEAQANQTRMRPQPQWMNHAEYRAHLHQRGDSRKRRSSQMSQDEDSRARDDDAFQERRGRRRSPGQDLWLDPDERQLRDATEWYEKHGRFASVESPSEQQLREGTEWYQKYGRFASVDWPNDDDWEDVADHGRPRTRGHTPEGWVPDPDDIPNLSRSFTTSSNQSSWLEPPGADLERSRANFDKTGGGEDNTQKGSMESCQQRKQTAG